MLRINFATLVATAGSCLMLATTANATYTIRDLGTLPGGYTSSGWAISDNGTVCGTSGSAHADRAFRWTSAGGMVDLGTLTSSTNYMSQGYAVNNAGQVTGMSTLSTGTRAFFASPGSAMKNCGVLGYRTSMAFGINEAGQVVGYSTTATQQYHAFLWQDGLAMQDIPTMGGTYGEATDINNNGLVVGRSVTGATIMQAFLWDATNGTRGIGTLPGAPLSEAWGVNDNNVVVGYSGNSPTDTEAYIYHEATGMSGLGKLPGGTWSHAWSINNAEQVVGEANSSLGNRAFLWSLAAGMVDLNTLIDPSTPGWVLLDADGINASGQIVGTGTINGVSHAFVATPVSSANLQGTITPLDYSPDPSGLSITFEFIQGGSVLETRSVTLAAGGTYSCQPTSTGTLDVRVKGTHWLAKKATGIVLNAGGTANLSLSLANGDIDGDNSVTVFDYGVLSDYFDKSSADSDWLTTGSNGFRPADADLDGDDAVTVFDYGVISSNFDQTGD